MYVIVSTLFFADTSILPECEMFVDENVAKVLRYKCNQSLRSRSASVSAGKLFLQFQNQEKDRNCEQRRQELNSNVTAQLLDDQSADTRTLILIRMVLKISTRSGRLDI
jgi:hypothetical protein